MRIDALTRLIESSDFVTFRDIAFEALKLRGYTGVEISDGTSDGGRDFRIAFFRGSQVAIQTTTAKKWKSKLKSDASSVKRTHKQNYLLFIYSRRLADADFIRIKDDIFANEGVIVDKMDSQSIASIFYEAGDTGRILQLHGIQVPPLSQHIRQEDFKLHAEASFSLFGKAPSDLRRSVIRSAIIYVLASSEGPLRREDLEAAVASIIPSTSRASISGAVDSMLQKSEMRITEGTLLLSDRLHDHFSTDRGVNEHYFMELRATVNVFLSEYNVIATSEVLDNILNSLGALVMAAAHDTGDNISYLNQSTDSFESRIRALHIELDAIGFPEGRERDTAINELCEIASTSPAGQRIFTSELFFYLSQSNLTTVFQALGASLSLSVVLDASVAIPLLCSLLFKPTDTFSSRGAYSIYKLLSQYHVRMVLPTDYLEEVTVHMIDALRRYAPIIDTNVDSDMSRSKNFYVSHYVELHNNAEVSTTFVGYLTRLGYRHHAGGLLHLDARQSLMDRLAVTFSRYGIETMDFRVRKEEYEAVLQDTEWIASQLRSARASVTIRHDARTAAYLKSTQKDTSVRYILCTMDNLHFRLRDHYSGLWECMTPVTLADILSVLAPNGTDARIVSPALLARAISERDNRLGAEVWDELVKIEGVMYDAELLEIAHAFKQNFLQHSEERISSDDIRNAWIAWKERHGVPEDESDSQGIGEGENDVVIVIRKELTRAERPKLVVRAYLSSPAGSLRRVNKKDLNDVIRRQSHTVVALESFNGPRFLFQKYMEDDKLVVGVVERFGRRRQAVTVSDIDDVSASNLLRGVLLLSQGDLFFPWPHPYS